MPTKSPSKKPTLVELVQSHLNRHFSELDPDILTSRPFTQRLVRRGRSLNWQGLHGLLAHAYENMKPHYTPLKSEERIKYAAQREESLQRMRVYDITWRQHKLLLLIAEHPSRADVRTGMIAYPHAKEKEPQSLIREKLDLFYENAVVTEQAQGFIKDYDHLFT